MCYADIDNDGDIDVLFIPNGTEARLLRNDQQLGNNWLRVQLKDTSGASEAIGAKVVLQVGAAKQTRLINPTRSYLSQCELPATFGFGKEKPSKLTVTWPDGSIQDVAIEGINKTLLIEKAASQPAT
jgi:enediyne biosynthesis protein E4